MIYLKAIPSSTLGGGGHEECVHFYRDKLLPPANRIEENLAQFATRGTKLYLRRLIDAPDQHPHNLEIHFEGDAVDQACRAVLERKVTFEQPPTDIPWGMILAAQHAPEGYTLRSSDRF
ncbi:MAG: hypothetical protein JXB85_06445 [Anaerolineales bacterium]|nr:hypothetical protein [Anaerolineales bacterium]